MTKVTAAILAGTFAISTALADLGENPPPTSAPSSNVAQQTLQSVKNSASASVLVQPELILNRNQGTKPVIPVTPGLLPNFSASIGTRGGGDDVQMTKDSFLELIAGDNLKKLELQYIETLDLNKIPNGKVRDMFIQMLNNGLENDIKNSKYIPATGCLDGYDQNKSASTWICEKPTSDICFDVDKIVQDNPSDATLVALALHEHSHHYCYNEDDAYALSQVVGADLLLKQGQTGLDHSKALQGLVSQIKSGSELVVKRPIHTLLQPVFQRGKVLDGTGSIEPGVYCYYSNGYEFAKGTYKVIGTLSSFEDDRYAVASDGQLNPVTSHDKTTTDVELLFKNGDSLSCRKNPDTGSQITIGELSDAVFGSIELKLKK